MKYKLISPIKEDYSTVEQILENRGIPKEEAFDYLNTTDDIISHFSEFGEAIYKGVETLIKHINKNSDIFLPVDCDCDGQTSAALLLNYLHNIYPAYVTEKIHLYFHSGKQHGLSDCINEALKYDLIMVLDAGSNDYEYHKILKENNKDVIILDHHEADRISSDAIVINNQLSDYPNKELSGVGVTWQFCKCFDSIINKNYADKYMDLMALGLVADMMSLRSKETKHLIAEGLRRNNIRNPFISGMAEKNAYSLGSEITPIGVAFYIAPLINAICRSGTLEEKALVFDSMLQYKAYNLIPSNKRGHKLGEEETVLAQALRTCTNVKNRQTREQDKGLELLEKLIEEKKLLDNKVLLFNLEPGQVTAEVRGLVANKLMAKYQRPCCVLTRVEETDNDGTKVSYQGSARGYDKGGITNFKDICMMVQGVRYAEGHQGAFGLCIEAEDIQNFIVNTNEILKDVSTEPCYLVDYIFHNMEVDADKIISIGGLKSIWGKDVEESKIAISGLVITKDLITLMSPDKKPTLKITLPNGVTILKFNSSMKEYGKLCKSQGFVEINLVGSCNINTWLGRRTPQIFIEDYEIVRESEYLF